VSTSFEYKDDCFCRDCVAVRKSAKTPGQSAPIWNLVVKDMLDRDALGEAKYGTRLQAHNGRDVLKDAYEEALDLAVYLRQALYEKDGK
jgi:hypothetical protein